MEACLDTKYVHLQYQSLTKHVTSISSEMLCGYA